MPEMKDIMKSLNQTKDHDLIDDFNSSDYVPWVINRAFSYYPDVITHSEKMNNYATLDKILQYKYYLYAVRKKSRFSPWLKYKLPEDVQLVKEYYGYSTKKAKEILPLLNKDDLDEIRKYLDKGGVK